MTPAPLFHVALRLDGERCLVVGAGPVAVRKARSLLECGADVTVVAPEISPAMEALATEGVAGDIRSGRLGIERRPFAPGDLDSRRLAVTATGLPGVDRAVFAEGERRGVLVNAADDPEACSFLVPAVLRSGPVSVSVSTGGTSPYLAGWLRTRLGELVGSDVELLAELVAEARASVRAHGVATSSLDWDGLVDGHLWPLVKAGKVTEARRAVAGFVLDAVRIAG